MFFFGFQKITTTECDDNCENDQCSGQTVGGKCNKNKCKVKYTWESDDCFQCYNLKCSYCDGEGKDKCDVDRCENNYRLTTTNICESKHQNPCR